MRDARDECTIPTQKHNQNKTIIDRAFLKQMLFLKGLKKNALNKTSCQINCEFIQQFCIWYEYRLTKKLATKQLFKFFKNYTLSIVKLLLNCTQTFNKRLKSRLEIISCLKKYHSFIALFIFSNKSKLKTKQ